MKAFVFECVQLYMVCVCVFVYIHMFVCESVCVN